LNSLEAGFPNRKRVTLWCSIMENDYPGLAKIAIIGMHGRFPGADSIDQLWDNVSNARCQISNPPSQREHLCATDKQWDIKGGFLEEIKKFDSEFFGISPNESKMLDPQQRLLLEVAWGMIEDAGYTDKQISRQTGVFVGAISQDYGTYLEPLAVSGDFPYRGSDRYQLANRISFFLDLSGPSFTIDTACSSSAAAVHLACESLRRQECPMAIAAGVNLFLHPSRFIQYRQLGIISPSNECLPFGIQANGTVYGEGICSILLKPLDVAESDGDNIHGVILASAMNSGGRTQGFTVPNRKAQKEVIKTALKKASIDPNTIGYIEAHGTATTVGDPIELRGLKEAFDESSSHKGARQFCALGSIKGNIGHLESTAALAGMVKVLKQMQHQQLAPTLHGVGPSKIVKFEQTPFFLQKDLERWPAPVREGIDAPRRAGVSSFGAGGGNVHILLEEYVPADLGKVTSMRSTSESGAYLFPFSGSGEDTLSAIVSNFVAFFENDKALELDPSAVAYTLQVGRINCSHRVAVVADSCHCQVVAGSVQQDLAAIFQPEAEGSGVINELAKTGAWLPLAALWTRGAKVDWHKYYESLPRRVSLPSYPFDGPRYWLPKQNTNISVSDGSVTRWPGQKTVVPSFAGINYIGQLSLDSMPYVAHHRIFDQAVVPGSWYVALAFTTIKAEDNTTGPWVLENTTFHETLQIDSNSHYEICCAFANQENGVRRLDILSRDLTTKSTSWINHFSSYYVMGTEKPVAAESSKLDLNAIRDRCKQRVSSDEFYELGASLGFAWSGPFRAITQLRCTDGEAIGTVNDHSLDTVDDSLVINPALLDACFQVYLKTLKTEKLLDGHAYIPLSCDRIVLYGVVSNPCWSTGRLLDESSNGAVVIDAEITSKNGDVCMCFDGLQAFQVSSEDLLRQRTTQNEKSTGLENWYYQTEWKSVDKDVVLQPNTQAQSVFMVIRKQSRLREPLQETLDGLRHVDSNFVCFESDCTAELRRLLQKEPSRTIAIAIVLEAPTGSEGADLLDLSIWKPRLKEYVLLLNSIVGDFAKIGRSLDVKLWLITCSAQHVSSRPRNPMLGGFWGLGRSLAYEYPDNWGGMIDVNHQFTTDDASNLISVVTSLPDEDQYALCQGNLKVPRVVPFEFTDLSTKKVTIHGDGCYVISGGLGSIGQVHANWLLQSGAGHVALLGRSVNRDDQLKVLEEKFGADRVSYLSVDVSDTSAVKRSVQALRDTTLPIKGLIHTAGILADGIFENITWDRYDSVLSAKVYGAINLIEALKKEKLDFIGLTSTATSVLGSAGQANYTMANACLDGIAVALFSSQYPVVSVNWGPWENTSMIQQMDDRAKKNSAANAGQYGAIKHVDAPGYFNRIYSCTESQLLVLPRGWEKFVTPLARGRIMSTWRIEDSSEKLAVKKLIYASTDSTESVISRAINDILGYGVQTEFNFTHSFQQIGFDSLSAVKLRNQLNSELQLSLPATVVFDYPTPFLLVEKIESLRSVSPAIPEGNSDTDDLSKIVEDVTQMSEEEAERLLGDAVRELQV